LNEVDSIISQLEEQRSSIERAISALREISSPAPRRGRRPGTKLTRTKRVLSPEGRARIAEAARRRWANLKKAQSQATAKGAAKKTASKKRSAVKRPMVKRAAAAAAGPAQTTATE
jgi:hypothetical protein